MGSGYNAYLDRILGVRLTASEYRLAIAFARLLPGWNRGSAQLGRKLVRETAGLDGRTFDRALAALIEKSLIRHTPGQPGRGNRGTFELVLISAEKTAPERTFEDVEKVAPARSIPETVKGRSRGTEKVAPQRPRKGSGKGKASGTTPNFHRRVFDAYINAGGTLQLDRDRGPLARQATSLLKSGIDEKHILAAAQDLGRRREFTGHLKQRAEDIARSGGICQWETLGRSALTITQLHECGCQACNQWADALTLEVATP